MVKVARGSGLVNAGEKRSNISLVVAAAFVRLSLRLRTLLFNFPFTACFTFFVTRSAVGSYRALFIYPGRGVA